MAEEKPHPSIENPEDESWIEIDPDQLAEECEKQVKLRLSYGKLLAKQRKAQAQKKNALKVLMAEVDKEVRDDPAKFGIKPPLREGPIDGAVLCDPRVQAAVAEHIEEEFWVGIREAEVEALDDRKSMLEKAVLLFLAGFRAAPKMKEVPSKKEWEWKRDQETDAVLNSTLNPSGSKSDKK